MYYTNWVYITFKTLNVVNKAQILNLSLLDT